MYVCWLNTSIHIKPFDYRFGFKIDAQNGKRGRRRPMYSERPELSCLIQECRPSEPWMMLSARFVRQTLAGPLFQVWRQQWTGILLPLHPPCLVKHPWVSPLAHKYPLRVFRTLALQLQATFQCQIMVLHYTARVLASRLSVVLLRYRQIPTLLRFLISK